MNSPRGEARNKAALVAGGQGQLRAIDGWRKIAAVRSQQTAVAA